MRKKSKFSLSLVLLLVLTMVLSVFPGTMTAYAADISRTSFELTGSAYTINEAEYLLVGSDGTNYYAVQNNDGVIAAKQVYPDSNVINITDSSIVWTAEETSDGYYYFKNNGKYLCLNSDEEIELCDVDDEELYDITDLDSDTAEDFFYDIYLGDSSYILPFEYSGSMVYTPEYDLSEYTSTFTTFLTMFGISSTIEEMYLNYEDGEFSIADDEENEVSLYINEADKKVVLTPTTKTPTDSVTLEVDETINVVIKNSGTEDADFAATAGDTAIATISPETQTIAAGESAVYEITAVGDGITTISFTDGASKSTKKAKVNVNVGDTTGADVAITPSTSNVTVDADVYVDNSFDITITNGSSSSSYTFTATVANTEVASIDKTSSTISKGASDTFTVTGLTAGTTTISFTNSASYYARTATVNLTVKEVKQEEEDDTVYTVTFDMNGVGKQVSSQSVKSGKFVTEPQDPTADLYDFAGWYADEELTQAYDFDTPVTSNITIYAKWERNANYNFLTYRTHVQTYGWQGEKHDGEVSGTSGESKRLEAIEISLADDLDGSIVYTTHVQTYGWLKEVKDGAQSGTSGESKRLEAIKIYLTGDVADEYDVYYRVHAQHFGWLGWAKNGAEAGTAGYAYRLEAIQIVLVEKGGDVPSDGSTDNAFIEKGKGYKSGDPDELKVTYTTHVQTYGWQDESENGQIAGTSGESKRLEAIKIKIENSDYEGSVVYSTHVQTYGWMDEVEDYELSGTSGQSKRLEAIKISLTGELAEHYDIYYRVHAQHFGWLGWASNGEEAGTSGYAYRLEAIQIVLVEKDEDGNSEVPGDVNDIVSASDDPYWAKN